MNFQGLLNAACSVGLVAAWVAIYRILKRLRRAEARQAGLAWFSEDEK